MRLLLGTGTERSKIVVRFDLTLDGTLKVTATQSATGISKELKIDNALSQFPATVALLEKADSLGSSVDEADAEDIRTLTENVMDAMASDDQIAVATLSEELDDILFYVQ